MSTVEDDSLTRRGTLAGGVALTLGLAGCVGTESSSTPTNTATGETATATETATPTETRTETQTATPATGVETVVSISGERVPENLAFDADGNLYFGITAGEVRRLTSDRTGETGLDLADTEQLATTPGAIGVEVGPDGTVYVAAATQDTDAGVWTAPSGEEASQLVGISGFPNDILFDAERDRMLVTESSSGVVYTVGTDGSRETWLDDDRLATESFGANGITRTVDGTVYVAVTRAGETGRLIEVPVHSDGSAGEASTLLESEAIFGADGITARDGDLYVAANSQNRVVRVDTDGATETVATADDGLVFPSDVLFAPGSDDLFICNFANQSPENGAILRRRL
jgi:hypothetical protein